MGYSSQVLQDPTALLKEKEKDIFLWYVELIGAVGSRLFAPQSRFCEEHALSFPEVIDVSMVARDDPDAPMSCICGSVSLDMLPYAV